jgi:hypothetical protein
MIKGAAALLLLAALGVAPAGPSTTVDLGTEAAAHRLTPDTIAWDLGPDPAGKSKQLGAAPAGGLVAGATGLTGGTVIPLTYDPAGLSPALKAKYPNLASLGALHVSARRRPAAARSGGGRGDPERHARRRHRAADAGRHRRRLRPTLGGAGHTAFTRRALMGC